jgi:sec-independent protein translocase protein TatB
MFDMSWGEVMVIGAVALIVIGPKDLPRTLRGVGSAVAKMRRMAGEFQGQFHEALREADVEGIKNEVQDLQQKASHLGGFNPLQAVRDEIKTITEMKPLVAGAGAGAGMAASAAGPALASAAEQPLSDPVLPDIAPPDLPPIADPALSLAASLPPETLDALPAAPPERRPEGAKA